MMKTIEAVLFDLDGTLIDTAPDFIWVLNTLRQEKGQQALPEEIIRQQVSNGARALVTLGFQLQEGEEGFEPLRDRLLELYAQHLSVRSALFEGMNEVLLELEARSIPWGIVTNKPSTYAKPLIENLTLSERCGCLICPDHVTHRKPHAEPLLKACDQLQVNAVNTLYVGDHIRDIECGRNAGSTTVAALYGYIDQDDQPHSWNADHYVDEPSQLSDLIESIHPSA